MERLSLLLAKTKRKQHKARLLRASASDLELATTTNAPPEIIRGFIIPRAYYYYYISTAYNNDDLYIDDGTLLPHT